MFVQNEKMGMVGKALPRVAAGLTTVVYWGAGNAAEVEVRRLRPGGGGGGLAGSWWWWQLGNCCGRWLERGLSSPPVPPRRPPRAWA